MRKFISLTFVFAMMLTLFVGLFGGVVEDGGGTATYDSGTNTIYLTGDNTLPFIYGQLSLTSPGVLHYNAGIYSTNASIQIIYGGTLNIVYNPTLERALLFDYNSSGPLNFKVFGTLTVTGSQSGLFRFDSNKSSPSRGDWVGLIFDDSEASDSVLDYVKISNASIGVKCNNSNPTITNSIVRDNVQNGIFIKNSSPIIEGNKIINNGNGNPGEGGISIDNSITTIDNCTLMGSLGSDFILLSNSNVTMLNTTFNDNALYITPNSRITVKWYLHILITENDGTSPINGALIDIENKTGVSIEGSPFTTDDNGFVRWIKTIEYTRQGSSEKAFHTPHDITVTHDEYYTNYTTTLVDMSKLIQINLTMIRRDLTIAQQDITFSEEIPIAGENLTVYANIHNVEVDDAENVRVKIFDITTDNTTELYHIIIPEIKGNSYEEISKRWKPIPGTHTIEVQIDPDNEIKEINSTMGGDWAENNNEASNTIDVNGRPIADITFPLENAEVNETINIEGTAFDDFRDDGMVGNNISRVDIRLEGKDWIEIYPGPNLNYNFATGFWEWQYEWDTTQWNGTTLPDGNYTLNARAWDNYHLSFIDEVNITVNNTGANTPPNAVINEPISGSPFNVNDTITFNGSDSNDAHTAPENLIYSWDFDDTVDSNGDGNYTNDEEAFGNITTHVYDKKGIFTITLTVIDEGNLNDTDTVSVDIFNYRPVPVINVSDTEPFENDTVTFNATESYDSDGLEALLEYFWDFDDGTYWTGIGDAFAIVDHAFNESRLFNVTLTLTDSNATSNITWIYIDVGPNAQPNAVINDPDYGDYFSVKETIYFNASGSSDENDEDLEYYWDFGDGNNTGWMSEPLYWYDYKQKGPPLIYDYTVTLRVRDNEMAEDQMQIEIRVPNNPPVAKLLANLSEAYTNEMITFWGNESDDDDGSIINYTWDFGDGVIYSEYYPDTDEIASHSYADDGVYTINLTVTDNAQITYPGINPARDYAYITITIKNREPIITEATADPQTTTTGKTVYFNVTASDMDGNITKYEWNFGQGYVDYTSTSGEATHSFNTKGTKLVWVRVTDDDGAQTTKDLYVNITNAPPDINITEPESGTEVGDEVIIKGTASDPDIEDSVTDVYVKIGDDNDDWYVASGTESWTFNWDTTDLLNGPYTIYARSYDGEDYSSVASVSVTVDNPPTDIEVTINFNQTYVHTGSSVRVFGDVTYQNGDPAEGTTVNITIQTQDSYWTTLTESDGSYSEVITAPETAGNYQVRATAIKGDYSDVIQKTLYVSAPPAKPDLKILSSDIDFNPSAPDSGMTVTITVTVRNIGDADANNVLVNAYIGDPDAGGTQIEPQGSETVSVSANSDDEVYLTWDTGDLSGQIYIYVELDRPNDIDETDEDNNKAYKPIDVTGKPDFSVEPKDISFSKSNPKVKEAINIRIEIHNLGSESGEVEYEVYDGDPEEDGIMIESGTESINKDDYEMITVEWTPEESGDREIFVLLISDDDDNDANNQANKAISVEALPAEEGIPSWLLPLFGILVVIVIVLLLFLYMRGRGAKPGQDLPMAQVVKKEEKPKAVEDEEEKEKTKGMLESHGGIRLG